jgi:Cytochrome c3
VVSTILTTLILALLSMGTPAGGQGQTYAQTRSPHGNLNLPCQNCHTSLGWKPIRAIPEFDHNRTSYPLGGMHQSVTCTQCHTKPVFSNVGTKCADCHADIHKRQLGASCESCHTVRGWMVSVKQIQNHQNRFPLLGAHAAVECDACHKNGALSKFNTMPTDCYSCHASDFKGASNPNHVAAGFSTTCERCHGMNNWVNVKFDHSATGFPLTGAHMTVACGQCHVNGNFNLTSANTACSSCHLKDFQKTTNPNHVSAGFSQNCEGCHNTTAWQPATFDHSKSGFPLTGAHANAPCASCHVNNNYNLTSSNTVCVSCHLKDFQGTNNPNHVQQAFAQTCQVCHNTTAWQPAQFDHTKSGFPLTGAHATTPCAQCHVNNNYNLTNTACVSCHLKDFQGTTSPNHVQANFPQACQQCHNTTNWGNATFNHASTGWPLTGFHVNTPCLQCHVNGNYNLTSANTACVSCHLKDYQATNDPNHAQAGFPTTCQQCHNTTDWGSGTFNHASTGWALTGFHATVSCQQCHVNANYKLTSANTQCASCHMNDFNTTNNPPHASAGFPTDCSVCHSTTNWLGASFNHASTGWALTGFHATVQCNQCHVNNNYKLTSTVCVTCHLKDFQSATNPNHVASGFPQQCDVCHNTAAWIPSSFNHNNTPFPLTGFHTKVPCAQCHVNNNYTSVPTACYSCHQADYNATNNPNHLAAGFPTTCATCHTTTSWLGATFNHTWFPTNHGGANGVCSTCHTNPSNYLVFTCTNCHQKTQTDSNHQGVSGYVYNSTNCYNCHRNGGGGG